MEKIAESPILKEFTLIEKREDKMYFYKPVKAVAAKDS
jgi:hypothetical protein